MICFIRNNRVNSFNYKWQKYINKKEPTTEIFELILF